MKLNIKVTSKDLTIFICFCIFLLYFSAILVLNVLTLINDGTFYGLSPFEAFTKDYILITLFIFFIVLVIIFFSVSKTIFDTSDGIGFSIGEKENKGYSRWLKEKEMKKAFKVCKVGVKAQDADAAGVVFINDGKDMWVDDGESHTLVIGTTGSGKTTAVVDPLIYSLCKHKESMVITDPKGEIYINHAELLKARGYKIVVLNFRQPNKGNAWNPLTLPYRLYKEGNVDKAVELIDDVGSNIVKDKKSQDPFWENSASDYFSGCALGLVEDAKEEEVNLNSIQYMTTVGEEKFGAGSDYIKEYFKMKGESSSAYVFASNTINSPNETKGGILSVFRQKIRLFSSREQLSEMLAYSDFEMSEIGKVPTALFLIIHDEKTTYHALATIFIKQCYETLIDVAQANGGKLPVRTNFILDEFANMPPLKDVTTMVTAARSRSMRFTFIIQNFAQLNEVYGKEDAETIRSNCGNLIYILTTELSALEEISKLCGEVKAKDDEKAESHPLISVADLQKLQMNEVIIIRHRMHPFKTKLKQGFDTDWGDKEFGKAEFYEREKQPIQLFEIKDFVKVRKRSKMGLDDDKGGIPGGGSPFANLMGGGLSSMDTAQKPRIPSFEEFMASRNNTNARPNLPRPDAPTFDVDDLVKRIDAKIAELEAQEKAEEEAKKNASTKTPPISTPTDQVVEKIENNNINPFIEEKTEVLPTFIPKEAIKEEKQENVPFKTFDDMLSSVDIGESKNESVTPIVQNTIDTDTKPPIMADEPMFTSSKPLTGIVDPTHLMTIEEFEKTRKALEDDKVVESVTEIPHVETTVVEEKHEEPVIVKPVETVVVNTTTTVPVDTESKVIETLPTNSNVTDDEFFDDFFDN